MADKNTFDLEKSKTFFKIKEEFALRDFERKKELAYLRFDLAVKLANILDEIATKRHKERCEVLGIKYVETRREQLIADRVPIKNVKK
jgi:hypothetical protein